MKTNRITTNTLKTCLFKKRHNPLATSLFLTALGLGMTTQLQAETFIGNDLNSAKGANSAINQLYSGNRGSNGGGDQSLQFGDNLTGTYDDDILIGGLGIDVLFGYEGDDILIGGTEDFNPFNRDRAFGNEGHDTFIWTPGDGNDFFDGGAGLDVLIISLIGESQDSQGNTDGAPFFGVNPPSSEGSQDFDGIYLDPTTGLPIVDVLAGPGFCDIIDNSDKEVDALGLDHLVRFTLRGPANAFDEAVASDPHVDQATLDTGLRIAVHLKNTEYVVCNSRHGDEVEVFDLRYTPAQKVSISELPAKAYQLLQF